MKTITVTDVRCQKGDSAFLLDDGITSILYDSGFGFTGFRVAENIRKVLGERKLDYIFLTHSHYDHALGSAYIVQRYPDTKVVAGRYAAEIFNRPGAKKVMKQLDRAFADYCGEGPYEFLGDALRVDIPVDDGDIVQAGTMTFRVLGLPGHTRCSVGYYEIEQKMLLSTETVGLFDGQGHMLPSFLVGYQMSLDSMEKLKQYEIHRILAPHFGVLSAEDTSFFLQNMRPASEYFAAKICEMVRQGRGIADVIQWFKDTYWHGYVKEIYPEAALDLNTTIMVNLIRREVLGLENE